MLKLGPVTNLDKGGLDAGGGGGGGKGGKGGKKKTIAYPLKDYAALIAALSDVSADEHNSYHVKALEKCVVRCQEYDPDLFNAPVGEVSKFRDTFEEATTVLKRILTGHWQVC